MEKLESGISGSSMARFIGSLQFAATFTSHFLNRWCQHSFDYLETIKKRMRDHNFWKFWWNTDVISPSRNFNRKKSNTDLPAPPKIHFLWLFLWASSVEIVPIQTDRKKSPIRLYCCSCLRRSDCKTATFLVTGEGRQEEENGFITSRSNLHIRLIWFQINLKRYWAQKFSRPSNAVLKLLDMVVMRRSPPATC